MENLFGKITQKINLAFTLELCVHPPQHRSIPLCDPLEKQVVTC